MLQQFLRTASDGWDLALASARNLFAEADLHADEVGGDFAGEAHRLGATVSEIHELLRRHFGTSPFDAKHTAEAMRDRLEAVTAAVPDLAERAAGPGGALRHASPRPTARRRSASTATCTSGRRCAPRWAGSSSTSRASRSSRSEQRKLPDSPWRDVAGMLRSFDYAAQSVVRDLHSQAEPGSQIVYRANEWTARNRTAFLDGLRRAPRRARRRSADHRRSRR